MLRTTGGRTKEERFTELGLIAGTAAAVLYLWIVPSRLSLNIDEAVTFWSIGGDLSEMVRKVTSFQNQTPFYYCLLKLSAIAFGTTELALRSVSLLAGLGSTVLVFFLGARISGRRAGFLAAFFFVMLPPVITAATTARSYAVAILFSLAASFLFWLWLDTGRKLHLFLYAVCFALSVYGHFLFGAAAVMHGCWFLLSPARRSFRHLMHFISALCFSALLLLPASNQIHSIRSRQSVLSYSGTPASFDLLFALVPQGLLISFGLALIFALFESRENTGALKLIPRGGLIRLLLWWLAPATICFAVSRLSSSPIFIERYFSWGAPAFALLMGTAIASFPARRADAAGAIAFAVAQLFVLHQTYRGTEDWGSAIDELRKVESRDQLPVLAYTGLVEARDPAWLTGEHRDYLLSPFSYYPISTGALALPAGCAPGPEKQYINSEIMPRIASAQKIALIVRMTLIAAGDKPLLSDEYFQRCLESRGFRLEEALHYDHVALLLLSK